MTADLSLDYDKNVAGCLLDYIQEKYDPAQCDRSPKCPRHLVYSPPFQRNDFISFSSEDRAGFESPPTLPPSLPPLIQKFIGVV